MAPKISIITITWNSEKHVEETIKSVVSQDYDHMEYIIVDGASTDRTMAIVKQYQDKITSIISEPDKGISDAFNKGIRAATGDIIGIVNSDDILMPNALRVIAETYEEGIDIYRANEIIWNMETGAKFQEKPSMAFSPTGVLVHVTHESSFVSRTAYEKYGLYDTAMKYTMDLDFFTRAYLQGARMKYVDFDTTVFRLGGTTDHSIYKKKNDYILTARKNGAGIVVANLYFFRLLLFDLGKRVLNCIHPDLKKKIRLKVVK